MSLDKAPVMLFAIHRTTDWWRHIGHHLGWGKSVVVSDLRGDGDISLAEDFYAELRRLRAVSARSASILSDAEIHDVIARCRTLRWLDKRLASDMAVAMATAIERLLDRIQPRIVLSFPVDRYVMDVLERVASKRRIPYFELTASVVPDMAMLLRRGALINLRRQPSAETVRTTVAQIGSPAFVPTYVRGRTKYTPARFIRTLGYFRLRALAFRAIAAARRDPLGLHYLDAQPFLGHKCRWKDIRIVRMCNERWRDELQRFTRDKRVLFGLQLFPEASIDYWLRNIELVDHENLLVEAARSFSEQGFLVLVKDHPLQFGFRHTDVLVRLLALPNVVLVPYDISGNELMELVGVNFTCTGTLGLQAALAGITSVVTESYYAEDPKDFLIFRDRQEVAGLGQRALAHTFADPVETRRERIISRLLRGSFRADFFSFQGFDPKNPSERTTQLAQALGERLSELQSEGQV